jgi:hypothetical protein
MVVFVEEDVAASEMWQETEDGQTDGLQFLPDMCWFSSCVPKEPRASSLPFSTAPQPYPELSQCM